MISGQEQGLTSGDKALDALARFEDKEDLESLKSILWFCLHSDWIVREHALTLLQRKSLSFSLFSKYLYGLFIRPVRNPDSLAPLISSLIESTTTFVDLAQ